MWHVKLLLLFGSVYLALTNLYASPKVDIQGSVVMDQFSLLKPKNYQNQTSGANLRAAGLFLEVDFQNNIKLKWDIGLTDSGKANIGTLFLSFEQMENTHILVGQIPSPFCLENSNRELLYLVHFSVRW